LHFVPLGGSPRRCRATRSRGKLARQPGVPPSRCSDRGIDNNGWLCGKVWHDEVRQRDNLDLPIFDQVLGRVLPALRPAGSRSEVFVTGHSPGGCRAVHAAARRRPPQRRRRRVRQRDQATDHRLQRAAAGVLQCPAAMIKRRWAARPTRWCRSRSSSSKVIATGLDGASASRPRLALQDA